MGCLTCFFWWSNAFEVKCKFMSYALTFRFRNHQHPNPYLPLNQCAYLILECLLRYLWCGYIRHLINFHGYCKIDSFWWSLQGGLVDHRMIGKCISFHEPKKWWFFLSSCPYYSCKTWMCTMSNNCIDPPSSGSVN